MGILLEDRVREGQRHRDLRAGGVPTYMFTARRYDEETGLYHYRHRAYDPVAGRFLQRDPLGCVDGPNLYQYAGNTPLAWTDPLGLKINQRNIQDLKHKAAKETGFKLDKPKEENHSGTREKYNNKLKELIDKARKDGEFVFEHWTDKHGRSYIRGFLGDAEKKSIGTHVRRALANRLEFRGEFLGLSGFDWSVMSVDQWDPDAAHKAKMDPDPPFFPKTKGAWAVVHGHPP